MPNNPRSGDDPKKSGSKYTQSDAGKNELSPEAVALLQTTVETLKHDLSLLRDQIALQTSVENGFDALTEAIRDLAPKQVFGSLKERELKILEGIIALHQRIDFSLPEFGSKWPEIIKTADESAKIRSLGS
ncbi:hypothetical protein CLG85_006925 [Yangia mangrovi]|uniref:Uncharacterized protein n=1 Tax=Alloyangia mangrovi TaxID=1779329 RepID=A0A2A3JXE0_9RHOB|nr:hypothetical protein [Alloyangia mangrovi]MCA0939886.1 hypothetical protein [Alloyangia pacifica]MCA0945024.1 hypothetical protein [Alloyangia pacifica]MCT4370080.1 hypothetical protein [Alloyangia mangrovi]